MGERCSPERDEGRFRIDFIDPLFAVAIHIGFVEALLKQDWLHDRVFPQQLIDLANVAMFIAALSVLVASWVGYHESINVLAIKGNGRFVLDIVLLILYILLLLYFEKPWYIAVWMVLIFMVYCWWDYLKTREYPQRYYGENPGDLVNYLTRCFLGWCNGREPTLMGGAVNLGWTIVLAIVAPLAFLPATNTEVGKLVFAVGLVSANIAYRYDKKHSGAYVCAMPLKVAMLLVFACDILLYSNLLAIVGLSVEQHFR
jgi:Ca2+/Na+ antiporter